jgi:hypothetical protein
LAHGNLQLNLRREKRNEKKKTERIQTAFLSLDQHAACSVAATMTRHQLDVLPLLSFVFSLSRRSILARWPTN